MNVHLGGDRVGPVTGQQIGQPSGAKGRRPVGGDRERKARRRDLVVGVQQHAARRIGIARHHRGIEIAAVPHRPLGADQRHRAAAAFAPGQAARRDHADIACPGGIQDVLHGGMELAQGRRDIGLGLGGVEGQECFRRAVARFQIGGREGHRAAVGLGNDGAVGGFQHLQDFRRAVPHLDDLGACAEFGHPVAGVGAVGARLPGRGFDNQVFRIRPRGREPPGDMAVVADQQERHAGHGRPGKHAVRGFQAGQIPQDRRPEFQVRVVGQERLAGRRARPRQRPGVGRRARRARAARIPIQGGKGCQTAAAAGHARKGRRCVAGVGRPQEIHLFRRQSGQHVETQAFRPPITRQAQGHQLAPDQAVGGSPGFRRMTKCQEFDGARPGGIVDPGVDPVGIGLQTALQFGRRGLRLRFGQPVDSQPTHVAVHVEGRRAQHFRQPPSPRAAHQFHLEEPVLGMDETEGEKGAVPVVGADARHAMAVAGDRHRRRKPRELQAARRLGKGRGEQGRTAADKRHGQRKAPDLQPTQPHREPFGPEIFARLHCGG